MKTVAGLRSSTP